MDKTFETAKGEIKYSLKNDAMFHIVMQRSERSLRGLVKVLMGLNKEEISQIRVLNPIHFGDAVDDKEIILDVEIALNNNRIIDIEVQVVSHKHWTNRSLFYAADMLTLHNPGKYYQDLHEVTHIGILDFHLFEENEGFFAKYVLQNPKTGKIFSDKLRISVLDLKRIDLATEEEKSSGLVYWAELFRATTWEDIRKLADMDEIFWEVGSTMYQAETDQEVKDYLRRRRIALMDYHSSILEAEMNGEKRGQELKLISIICKKLRKGETAEQIAEETEEDLEYIRKIVFAAQSCSPDFKEKDVASAVR